MSINYLAARERKFVWNARRTSCSRNTKSMFQDVEVPKSLRSPNLNHKNQTRNSSRDSITLSKTNTRILPITISTRRKDRNRSKPTPTARNLYPHPWTARAIRWDLNQEPSHPKNNMYQTNNSLHSNRTGTQNNTPRSPLSSSSNYKNSRPLYQFHPELKVKSHPVNSKSLGNSKISPIHQ